MAPILPGLSDRPELMEEVVRAARAAGASHVWANVLYLRPGTREHFMESLARHWPALVPQYLELYASRAYLPKEQVRPVQQTVNKLGARHGVGRRPERFIEPELRPVQLSLLA